MESILPTKTPTSVNKQTYNTKVQSVTKPSVTSLRKPIIDLTAIINNEVPTAIFILKPVNKTKAGIIKNSTVVRFPEINEYLQQNKSTLKDKRILFYCAHGHRSTLAVQLSKSYQFTNCVHLIGGLKNWKKEGLEL